MAADSPEIDQFTAALLNCQAVRRTGSAALNLAYVAAGRFDGFWAQSTKSWDVAAGVLLVEEAGGVVTRTGRRAVRSAKCPIQSPVPMRSFMPDSETSVGQGQALTRGDSGRGLHPDVVEIEAKWTTILRRFRASRTGLDGPRQEGGSNESCEKRILLSLLANRIRLKGRLTSLLEFLRSRRLPDAWQFRGVLPWDNDSGNPEAISWRPAWRRVGIADERLPGPRPVGTDRRQTPAGFAPRSSRLENALPGEVLPKVFILKDKDGRLAGDAGHYASNSSWKPGRPRINWPNRISHRHSAFKS